MSKLKILLLGSAGMAGHVLKKELLKLSDKIDLIDVARSSHYTTPIIKMDVTDFTTLEDLVSNSIKQDR